MEQSETMKNLKNAFRMSLIISSSIVVSLLIYVGIVEFIKGKFKPFHGFAQVTNMITLRYIFYAAAIVSIILLRILQRPLVREKAGENLKEFIHKLVTAGIITSALGELPAVLGLVLFLLTGLSRDFYVLLFVSLFLQFMYFPRMSVWEARLKSHPNLR